MSSAVVSFLLKQAGSFLWDYIDKGAFGKAKDQIGDLRKAQEGLLRDMTAMHFEQLIWNSIQKISYWTEQLQSALEEERKARESSGGHPPLPYLTSDMTLLVDAIGSMSDGVGFHMKTIISGVTGKGAVATKDGLIGAWNQNAHTNLANLDKMDYTIKDYLYEIEANLTAIAKILRDANELHCLVATSDAKRKQWSEECANAIREMQSQAWGLFPVALKRLKPSYTAAFVSEKHWWRFEFKGKGGRFLAVEPSTPWRGRPVGEWRINPAPAGEWRFAGPFAELDSEGVVTQSDKNTHRLVPIRSRIGDCRLGYRRGPTVDHDNSSDFDRLVFKVVPLLNTTEPEISFALKRDTTSEMVRENGKWKYFGHLMDQVFILQDEGVGQFEYIAPADEPSRCIIC